MALTAHFIDSESIDAGPIVMQMSIPINYNSTYKENENRLRALLPNFVNSLVNMVANNKLCQYDWRIENKFSYNRKLTKDELEYICNASSLNALIF